MADPGQILCYADYSQQEFLLQGALSEDSNMLEDYAKGDVYMAFGKRCGLIPEWGDKETHSDKRKTAKAIILGLAYGMGEQSLSIRLSCSIQAARRYIAYHKRSYPQYWNFVETTQATASLTRYGLSPLGWIRRYQSGFNPRAAQNFPIQSAGADCLTLSTIALHNAGFDILATVHDAVLILLENPDDEKRVRQMMTDSILRITGGQKVNVDTQLFYNHYIDEDGKDDLIYVLENIGRRDLVPELNNR
jgi:DNA polymerase I-like protein with 3'-5' exonuclease and polymerase domains